MHPNALHIDVMVTILLRSPFTDKYIIIMQLWCLFKFWSPTYVYHHIYVPIILEAHLSLEEGRVELTTSAMEEGGVEPTTF